MSPQSTPELARCLLRWLEEPECVRQSLSDKEWSAFRDTVREHYGLDRECQVLKLAGEGLSNADIGNRLHLAEGTVRNYLSEAIGKLNADNRIEAWRIARDQGRL